LRLVGLCKPGQVGFGLGVVGVDGEGAFEGRPGSFLLTAPQEHRAQVVPAIGVLGIEGEGVLRSCASEE